MSQENHPTEKIVSDSVTKEWTLQNPCNSSMVGGNWPLEQGARSQGAVSEGEGQKFWIRLSRFLVLWRHFLCWAMTFMTFIDPDRGHVTSRGRSLFAMSQEPGIRDLRVRVKNSVIRIFLMTSLPLLRNDLYDLYWPIYEVMWPIGPVGVIPLCEHLWEVSK